MKKNLKKLAVLSTLILGLTSCGGGNEPIASISSSDTPSSTSSSSESTDTRSYYSELYSNPTLISQTNGTAFKGSVADPTVVRGDDGYIYAVGTDGIMIRSEDGVNFTVVTNQVIPLPTWPRENGVTTGYNLWAPDLVKVQDQWIYYYSLSGWGSPIGIGYAVADEIAGPYTDMGKLFMGSEIGVNNCIDPQVFVDDDGKVYMTVGSFQGLYMVELTEDGMDLEGGLAHQRDNKTLIAGNPTSNWDGSQYEGSYIVKIDDYYYYFGSSGTCCEGASSTYRVYVARSESVTGPYIGSNNMPITQSGSGNTYGDLVVWAGVGTGKQVYGPGHNSIFLDDAGDYWMYYHAYAEDDGFTNRQLFIDKLLWDDNGFPYVENKLPSYGEDKDGPRFFAE